MLLLRLHVPSAALTLSETRPATDEEEEGQCDVPLFRAEMAGVDASIAVEEGDRDVRWARNCLLVWSRHLLM